MFMAVFIGALVGFLIFNFNPASIFMGDCGSMFVGFFLPSRVLLNQTGGRSRGLLPILAVPVLILFVPIFDTTFVTVLRKLWGRESRRRAAATILRTGWSRSACPSEMPC